MLTHKRRLIAKKLANGVRKKRKSQRQEIAEQFFQDQQDEIEEEEELGEQKLLDIPLEFIGLLPPEERHQLQEQFGNMPAYLFMTKREKRKYFQTKNQQFKDKIQNQKDQISTTHKKVKFKPQFEVLPFEKKEKVSVITETDCFTEKYQTNIHFG